MVSCVMTPCGNGYQLWELGTWRPIIAAALTLPNLLGRAQLRMPDGRMLTLDHLYILMDGGLLFEAFAEAGDHSPPQPN
jgi:hypothetical protein